MVIGPRVPSTPARRGSSGRVPPRRRRRRGRRRRAGPSSWRRSGRGPGGRLAFVVRRGHRHRHAPQCAAAPGRAGEPPPAAVVSGAEHGVVVDQSGGGVAEEARVAAACPCRPGRRVPVRRRRGRRRAARRTRRRAGDDRPAVQGRGDLVGGAAVGQVAGERQHPAGAPDPAAASRVSSSAAAATSAAGGRRRSHRGGSWPARRPVPSRPRARRRSSRQHLSEVARGAQRARHRARDFRARARRARVVGDVPLGEPPVGGGGLRSISTG